MDESKRMKIVAGLAGVGLVGVLYMYSGDILGMLGMGGGSDDMSSMSMSMEQKPAVKQNTAANTGNEPVMTQAEVREVPVKEEKRSNDYVQIAEKEKAMQNTVSIGELSDIKNQTNLYKAKAEMTREQVLYETAKRQLMDMMSPAAVQVSEPQANPNAELLALLESQKKELEALKNQRVPQGQMPQQPMSQTTVDQSNVNKEPSTPIAPPVATSGIQILSVQKINGMDYSAVIAVDGRKMKVQKGHKIYGDTIAAINKGEIRMSSGQKYVF